MAAKWLSLLSFSLCSAFVLLCTPVWLSSPYTRGSDLMSVSAHTGCVSFSTSQKRHRPTVSTWSRMGSFQLWPFFSTSNPHSPVTGLWQADILSVSWVKIYHQSINQSIKWWIDGWIDGLTRLRVSLTDCVWLTVSDWLTDWLTDWLSNESPLCHCHCTVLSSYARHKISWRRQVENVISANLKNSYRDLERWTLKPMTPQMQEEG